MAGALSPDCSTGPRLLDLPLCKALPPTTINDDDDDHDNDEDDDDDDDDDDVG
jgi:hypothetical protein